MPPTDSVPNASPLVPTENNPFKAYRAPWIGLSLLLIGLLNLVWAIWTILAAEKFSALLLIGLAIAAAGYRCLTCPYFVLAPNRLTVYNLIGSVVKRYPFTAYSNFHTDDRHLYIEDLYGYPTQPSAQKKSVKILKWLTKSADWRKLKAIISTSSTPA